MLFRSTALEKLKESVSRDDGLSLYGRDEVRRAVGAKAVSLLMISDELLRKDKPLNSTVEEAERNGARVLIFNSQDEAGSEFAAFKIAALLRFKLQY